MTEKRKRKAEALEKDAKTKKAKEEAYELKLCYLRCAREGACGRTPCVIKELFYCKGCDEAGRTCVQKSPCGKMSCPNGRARKEAGGTQDAMDEE
eukprot:m.400609 g.400609  ORF g.400609 m.400609 type:complete len:95 (-) comp16784_c0_seq17:104-388(-)